MNVGRFIVLEGGEGTGKSTQAECLVQRLEAAGHDTLLTHEPGDSALGVAIRQLLLHEDLILEPRAELLLLLADRAQHVAEVIRPALAGGKVVVSDRFTPSSLAYQGAGRGLGVDLVERMSAFAADDLTPALVIVLDLPDAAADARVGAARDRMEREAASFHTAVRAAYRRLAADHGWSIIDGTGARERVADRVWAAVEPILAL